MTAEGAEWPVSDGVLSLGDLEVDRGGAIRDARLVWQTHGTLNDARDNVIVYPCSYTATHEDLAWLIGPDGVLDPRRWFIVIPDMFSNGLSSSAADSEDFPAVVTMADNIHAQHRLLTGEFGVTRIAAAYGFSMGAGQAYHWAALYPDLVERAIVVCGSARTSRHNKVFLSGLLRTLEAAPEYEGDGRYRFAYYLKAQNGKPTPIFSVTMTMSLGAVGMIKEEYPGIKILMLSAHSDPTNLMDMTLSGAEGYIMKNSSTDELLFAIKKMFS